MNVLKDLDVFIVSSGRVGSTLLQSLLNASQQMYIPPESDFVARGYPFYGHKAEFEVQDHNALVELFFAVSQDNGWGMQREDLLNHLEKIAPQSFGEVFTEICQYYHTSQETKGLMWGIKHPV